MRGGDPLADLRGIALGGVAAEQPAGQRRDEFGQFRVHGGGRGGLFVAHTRPHGARGLCSLLMRALQRLGARALGCALGLGQQRIRRGGLFALGLAAIARGRVELLEGEEKQRAIDLTVNRYELSRGFDYSRAALPRTMVARVHVLELTAKVNAPGGGAD